MRGMFQMRDLPKYEAIRVRASRYPDLDTSALEAFLVLLRVASDVLDALEAFLAKQGTSQGKFTILMLLNGELETGLSPSDLAIRSGVTRATITGLLDGLSREKLIVREGDTGDRRKSIVRLTPRGAKVLDRMLPDYYKQVAELMRGLADTEKTMLVDLLMKMNTGLSALWAAAGRSTAMRHSAAKNNRPTPSSDPN
jgi:DNA-binding MarR family transcriptional regulator